MASETTTFSTRSNARVCRSESLNASACPGRIKVDGEIYETGEEGRNNRDQGVHRGLVMASEEEGDDTVLAWVTLSPRVSASSSFSQFQQEGDADEDKESHADEDEESQRQEMWEMDHAGEEEVCEMDHVDEDEESQRDDNESQWETYLAFLSLSDKPENNQHEVLHEDLQRGCRDWEETEERLLTPILLVRNYMDSFSIDWRSDSFLPGQGLSPLKWLHVNQASAEQAAKCCFRMESFNPNTREEELRYTYGTSFSVSKSIVMTAKHCTWNPQDTRRDSYRIVKGLPATAHCFSNYQTLKAHLKKLVGETSVASFEDAKMEDPITRVSYSVFGERADVVALRIDNSLRMDRSKVFHKFTSFLLPISITYAMENYSKNGTLAVALLSFPMFTEFMAKVEAANIDNDQRASIFDRYKTCVYDCWRRLMQKNGLVKSTPEQLKSHSKFSEMKEFLYNEIVYMLRRTFQSFCTGQMTCSVGKVLSYNDTTIACNYSCLSGSSGAALFSPNLPFEGVFFGIHSGPAEFKVTPGGRVWPDHNIATNTDNPTFVKYYFKFVLPDLPLPSSFGDEDRHRVKAFHFWLIKHLKVIIDSKDEVTKDGNWCKNQEAWFFSILKQMHDQKRLFLDSLSDVEHDRRMMKLSLLSAQLLSLSATAQVTCKDGYQLPKSFEELEGRLQDAPSTNMLMQALSGELNDKGIKIYAWGFPKNCVVSSVSVLNNLALAL